MTITVDQASSQQDPLPDTMSGKIWLLLRLTGEGFAADDA